MKKLHYRQVVAELAAIVAERPEYIYVQQPAEDNTTKGCLYRHSDGPGCLIGVWLNRFHDVSLDKLSECDEHGNVGALFDRPNGDLVLDFGVTAKALGFLSFLQNGQDNGVRWGAAFFYAIREAHE